MDGGGAGGGGGPRIFFIPGLGGEEPGTRRLCALLSDVGGVSILATPDLETRCADIYDLPAFVGRSCERLTEKIRTGPIILAGYSTGGVIAFLLGRSLQARGVEVAGIALFDTSASLPDARPFYFLRQMIRASSRGRWRAAFADAVVLLFAAAGLEDTLRLLIRLEGRIGQPRRVDTIRKRLLLLLWRRAAARLQLGMSGTPTILFAAKKARGGVLTPSRGWETHACALTIAPLAGDHWSMLAEPQLCASAESILSQVKALATARPAPTGVPTASPRLPTPVLGSA